MPRPAALFMKKRLMAPRSKLENLVASLAEKSKNQQKQYYLFGRIYFFIKDALVSDEVNIEDLIASIESRYPANLFDEIEAIFVGQFEELEERELEALYKQGTIYISNTLQRNHDYLENIIHELAHGLESRYGSSIYGDFKVSREFLGKRRRLKMILMSNDYDISGYNVEEVEYDRSFDDYLLINVGYPTLVNLTMGLFSGPYSATSLREYWASGFEDYFLGDKEHLRKISPQLYKKIEGIIENE